MIEAEETLPKAQRGSGHPVSEFIGLIAQLFALETRGERLTVDQRQQLRQRESTTVLQAIETLLLRELNIVLPQSAFGKALHYLKGQWPKLTRYVENGAWPISNNLCENAIRPFTVGRRNRLFYDTVAGANAAANLYPLIETCKANSVEPYRYLVELFTALPLAQTADEFESLLPWRISLKS